MVFMDFSNRFVTVTHVSIYREERGDAESGELHLQVPRWDGGHHASRWTEAPSGALYKASYCQVRHEIYTYIYII